MDPVDTYLSRVAAWLPRRRRDDVLAELRDAIEARIDAASGEKGRSLTAAETELVLQRFGHPTAVVARYVERRPVISSMLAFFYWRVLAVAMTGIVLVQLAVFGFASAQPGAGASVPDLLQRLVIAGLLCFACVTLSFIVLDRRYGERESRFM